MGTRNEHTHVVVSVLVGVLPETVQCSKQVLGRLTPRGTIVAQEPKSALKLAFEEPMTRHC